MGHIAAGNEFSLVRHVERCAANRAAWSAYYAMHGTLEPNAHFLWPARTWPRTSRARDHSRSSAEMDAAYITVTCIFPAYVTCAPDHAMSCAALDHIFTQARSMLQWILPLGLILRIGHCSFHEILLILYISISKKMSDRS